MATDVRVYRSDQIGGCVTVISTEQGSILIDYGEELPGSAGRHPEDDAELRELWNTNPPRAVFFTHYHGDHMGRFPEIPKDIPLYMGEICREVVVNIHMALERYDLNIRRPRKSESAHTAALKILEGAKTFRDGDIISVAGFTVEAIRTDHSAYDAYMFLVTAPDGTLILHTGDFRDHGYLSEARDIAETLRERLDGRRVDFLITEGTMMSRQGEQKRTEDDLYQDALHLFRDEQRRHVFLIVSSTNPDSIASFCRAADAQGIPLYCYSEYLKTQLETFRSAAKQDGLAKLYDFKAETLIPGWNRPDPTPACAEQFKRMREEGFLAIIKMNSNFFKLVEKFSACKPVVVYSLWGGYLVEGSRAYVKEWGNFQKAFRGKFGADDFRFLHTGGHADKEAIARLISAASPKREIIPIHTEWAAGFLDLPLDGVNCDVRMEDPRGALEELLRFRSGIWQARLPSGIDWGFRYAQGREITMTLSAKAVGLDKREAVLHADGNQTIKRENINMQGDAAAFEGWALVLRAQLGEGCRIRLALRDGTLPESSAAVPKEQMWRFGHYFRFLYRVMKFEEQYGGADGWFAVADAALSAEVARFRRFLAGNRFCNNPPETMATEKTERDYSEKYYELRFSAPGDPLSEKLCRATDTERIHSQLPVGLFCEEKSRKSSVFTGNHSAIDLWGVSEDGNRIHIFELKANGANQADTEKQTQNRKVGIITELMFYANYMHDLFVAENSWTPLAPRGDYRGYRALFDGEARPRHFRGVCAYMLSDDYHPLVDKAVLYLMNRNSDGKFYGRLDYRDTK